MQESPQVLIQKYTPPVPKFNQKLLEESDSGSSTEHHQQPKPVQIDKKRLDAKADKRRLIGIEEELGKQLFHLTNQFGDQIPNIETMALSIITQELLDQFKSKKYNCIAIAIAIHAVRLLYLPITLKQIFQHFDEMPEKQVKRMLAILQTHYPIKPKQQTNSFLQQQCKSLKLNEKFLQLCYAINDFFEQDGIIQGEHENVIAATIITIMIEILGMGSAVPTSSITRTATCCDLSVSSLLKRVNIANLKTRLEDKFTTQQPNSTL